MSCGSCLYTVNTDGLREQSLDYNHLKMLKHTLEQYGHSPNIVLKLCLLVGTLFNHCNNNSKVIVYVCLYAQYVHPTYLKQTGMVECLATLVIVTDYLRYVTIQSIRITYTTLCYLLLFLYLLCNVNITSYRTHTHTHTHRHARNKVLTSFCDGLLGNVISRRDDKLLRTLMLTSLLKY